MRNWWILLVGVTCYAQNGYPEAKVFAGDGVVVFRYITVINNKKTCTIKSMVENLSDSAYAHLEFRAVAKSDVGRSEFNLRRFTIDRRKTVLFSSPCPITTPSKGTLSLAYVRGFTVLPEERNGNQNQLTVQYLWSLPILKSDLGSVLLATDKGCAKSFGKASDAGGLEGRKALAEMVSLGCGFLIEDGNWVRVNEETPEYVLVELAEVNESQKVGWIERRFLHPPEEYSHEAAVQRATGRRPSATVPPPPQAPPVKANGKSWEVLDIDSRITESNGVWSRFAWKMKIVNNDVQSLNFEGEIAFEDVDGFIVDSAPVHNLIVGPSSTENFTGTKLITAASVDKVKGVRAKVFPTR